MNPYGLETRESIQRLYGTHPDGWFRWLLDRFEIPAPHRILDLGSGPGGLWEDNRERLPADWRVVLADNSLDMLRQYRRADDLPQIAGRVVLDARELPFAAGAFEAVLAIGLLDLIQQRERALREIRRVLAPNGLLYASAGGRAHLQELARLLRPLTPSARIGGLPETFGLENGREQLLRHFSRVELHIFNDNLVFDRVEPVLAYILSEDRLREKLPEEKRGALVEALRRALDEQGSLRVTIEKGLFVAV